MAIVYATKSGLWSDTDVWDDDTIPSIGDDVYTNGYDVTIDTTVVVNKLTNKSESGINAGGRYLIEEDVAITFNEFEPDGDTTTLIEILADCTVFLSGEITCADTNNITPGGFGILIEDSGIEDISIEVTSITASGDNSKTIACDVGTLDLTVLNDISGDPLGDSVAVYMGASANLALTVSGDIVGSNFETIRMTDGDLFADVSGSILGGSADNGSAILTGSGLTTLMVFANISGGSANNAVALDLADGSAVIQAGTIVGGSGEAAHAIYSAADNLELTANLSVIGGSGEDSAGVYISDSNAIITSGSIQGGSGKNTYGIYTGSGDSDIEASQISGGSADNALGVSMGYGDCEVSVISVFGGTHEISSPEPNIAFGISSPDTPADRLVVVDSVTALDSSPGIRMGSPSDQVVLTGTATASPNGTNPILAYLIKVATGTIVSWEMPTTSGGTTTLTNANAVTIDSPDPHDVRRGVVYDNGIRVGTLAIPHHRQVAFGIEVDNTVGTAALMLPQVVNYFGEQIRAAFDKEAGLVFIESTVYHGADANKERPQNPGPIIWVGSVEPLNSIDGDVWVYS